MGCGGTKIDEVFFENAHHIGIENIFSKDIKVDLTKNPNTYMLNSKNYFKEQNPPAEGKKFDDDVFPPEPQSLKGADKMPFPNEKIVWRRAREIWGEGVSIFGETISVDDTIYGEVKDAYFIGVIAALTNFPNILIQLFRTCTLPNDESAIQLMLKIEGVWTVILVDDYFPVHLDTGKPIFATSPTKHIWGVILEKAWAKINAGYGNIYNGLPREIFKTFTPFTTIPINVLKEDKEALWQNLKTADKNNCIVTATVLEGTEGISYTGLIEKLTYTFVGAIEKEVNGIQYRMIRVRNPYKEGDWKGLFSEFSEAWTEDLRKEFGFDGGRIDEDDEEYNNRKKDGIFWITYEDFIQYFHLISITVPIRPFRTVTLNIPQEQGACFNVVKLKFYEKGVLSIALEQQSYRFHKDVKKGVEIIENLMLAKIDKEAKKLISVDSCYNETLSTRIEPGEYLCVFQLDYKTAGIEDVKGYNVNIASSSKYQVKLMEPDIDLSVLKSIMLPKIESLLRYKKYLKESFVSFTGNKFEATSYGFLYLKNNMKESKYVKTNFYIRNFKSMEGELPTALLFEEKAKYLYLVNRLKAEEFYQTGVGIKFYKEPVEDATEASVPAAAPDKYFEDTDYPEFVSEYEFAN